MCLVFTFLGLLCGVFPGWLGGMIVKAEHRDRFNARQLNLYCLVWSWSLAAVVGTIVGSIVCVNSSFYFEFFGLPIHGVAWCGWTSAIAGGFVGHLFARLHS